MDVILFSLFVKSDFVGLFKFVFLYIWCPYGH